jgi:hypothetical protein
MAKGFDPELLTKASLNALQDIITSMSKVAPSEAPTTKEQRLIEYQGRMSVSAMEKFNAPTYISGVSFYLSPQDKDKHKAVGAMALYIEASSAEKLLKSFGYSVADDEEDEEALNACGKLCGLVAEGLHKELRKLSCPELTLSSPVSEKNSLLEGIEFGPSQTAKQEISFYFWKKKVLVLDVVLSNIATAH